jgi:hypothetical protein
MDDSRLTPWSRVLQKLTVTQQVKNISIFYGTRRFITVFTRARHWSLSWVRRIQWKHSKTISLRFILILSFHLHLGLPSGLFPSGFPSQIFMHFSSLPRVLNAPPMPSSLTWLPNNIWWSEQLLKLLIMQSSPASRHFLPLRSKYSPQHPVLKSCSPTDVWLGLLVGSWGYLNRFEYGNSLIMCRVIQTNEQLLLLSSVGLILFSRSGYLIYLQKVFDFHHSRVFLNNFLFNLAAGCLWG